MIEAPGSTNIAGFAFAFPSCIILDTNTIRFVATMRPTFARMHSSASGGRSGGASGSGGGRGRSRGSHSAGCRCPPVPPRGGGSGGE